MSYRYGVIGAGRQGVAAAYDLLLNGQASQVVFADRDSSVAADAAAFVTGLGDGFDTISHENVQYGPGRQSVTGPRAGS